MSCELILSCRRSLTSASVCGTKAYNRSLNGGLCPAERTVRLARPTAQGSYKVVLAPYSPKDAQGLQG
jgi:hypothetical protein